MEVLVNAIMKALGFTREQFDAHVAQLKNDVAVFAQRAENTEAQISEILENQRQILAWIESQESGKPAQGQILLAHTPIEAESTSELQ